MNGVVTGFDKNQEFALEWWWKNYKKHNDLPVCFVDYGMTHQAIEFCKSHGEYVSLLDNSVTVFASSWYLKPLAIYSSPFDRSFWIDIDCEVHSNIEQGFDLVRPGSVGLTMDIPTQFNMKYLSKPVATGIVICNKQNELIREWWQDTMSEGLVKDRGDQEILNRVLANRLNSRNSTTRITILPIEWQWLRVFHKENPNAKITHWTGPEGKFRIKQKIEKDLLSSKPSL